MQKERKQVSLVAIVLLSTIIFSVFLSSAQGYSANTTILCSRGGAGIPNIDLSIYRLRNGVPSVPIGDFQTDANGYVAVRLSEGEYVVEASSDGESGYHGYAKFSIDPNSLNPNVRVSVDMKPNLDLSTCIDLTSSEAQVTPVGENTVAVPIISAVPGKEGKEEIPMFANIEALRDQALRNKDNWSPIDLTTLDPATRETLTKYQKYSIPTSNGVAASSDTIGIQSVGDWFDVTFGYAGRVNSETSYYVWHPLALVDSELGLTHTLELSYYASTSFTISSEVKYSGISASASAQVTQNSALDHGPITCSGGQVKTYLSYFRHVYQVCDLMVKVWFFWMDTGIDFYREFVGTWYPASWWCPDGAQLPETRDTYLGPWLDSHYMHVRMTSEVTYTGSIGVSVYRGDIFGASATLTVSMSYGTQAHHYLEWIKPGYGYQLDLYAGRIFDINTYEFQNPG